jgi:hypothetical protein
MPKRSKFVEDEAEEDNSIAYPVNRIFFHGSSNSITLVPYFLK